MKCLDHRDVVIKHAVKQGRAKLRNALKCILEAISMHMVMVSRTSDLTAAEETCVTSVASCQVKADNPSASHERKHNLCISAIGA